MDLGVWILDLGSWILDLGSWNLEFGIWSLELPPNPHLLTSKNMLREYDAQRRKG